MRALVGPFCLMALMLSAAPSTAADQPCPGRAGGKPTPPAPEGVTPGAPMEPAVHATWQWATLQLLPSAGVVVAEGQPSLALEWQLTPLLWSHAMDPRLSPWRSFVVEPVVRQSGSLELFIAPQFWPSWQPGPQRWGSKLGLRTTVPVLHRGEYLAWSVASGYFWFRDDQGAMLETGAHIFFGVLGLTAGVNLGQRQVTLQSMLKVRIF